MNLERTKKLIHEGIDRDNPMESLIHVLESALELVSIPENEFCWSSWEDENEAQQEILGLINSIKNGVLPDRLKISVIFAPTGPLQELSMSSGWAKTYLIVAERFDEVEALLWQKGYLREDNATKESI
ncbi:MAG: hypothetical protein IPK50_16515 [Fibrobacterota bacterium]|nr:MAG: hypothetical protein IPK50_16515 [Fibrobacterota bacterium]